MPARPVAPPQSQQISPRPFPDFKNSQRLWSCLSITLVAASTMAGTRDDVYDTVFSAVELAIRSLAVRLTGTLSVTPIMVVPPSHFYPKRDADGSTSSRPQA
ncbi:hypothetical protein EDD18DRAFT_1367962 [Armillaria luteobubalina]|uniref:Uncharacterized protein n=1 Tax=Armillaria luteobubalina TaxID=153913 RepID=A0AA39NYZ0_9AGAR|nr:hypothetical protein EDD18DRAFT_1367962 [Armillaria luteobubalina]